MLDASALDSWQVLAERLGSFIGRRLPAQEVDDVLQDVLLRIHRNARQLNDESRFGPWVYSIARNAIIDHVRKRSAQPMASADAPPDGMSESESEPPLLDCVAPFVARLPTPYREAITLVELQALSHAHAAEIVGISVSGMKSRVQRGRRLLRAMFEECCKLAIDSRGRVYDAEARLTTSHHDGCSSPCRTP
jgi:RNA polymerase sigma-70 factor (ECF subfamily)